MKGICRDCDFRTAREGEYSECRRFPSGPRTHLSDWCGEFKPRESSPAEGEEGGGVEFTKRHRGRYVACQGCEESTCCACSVPHMDHSVPVPGGPVGPGTPTAAPGGPTAAPTAPTAAPDGPGAAPDPGPGPEPRPAPVIEHEYIWEVSFEDGHKVQVKGTGIADALKGFDQADFLKMCKFVMLGSVNTGFKKEGA